MRKTNEATNKKPAEEFIRELDSDEMRAVIGGAKGSHPPSPPGGNPGGH